MNKAQIIAQIGDLKEIDYKNTLAIASIIELLVDKGIIEHHEIARKARHLDTMTAEEILLERQRNGRF